MCATAVREVMLLKALQHPSVVSLEGMHMNLQELTMCLAFPYAETGACVRACMSGWGGGRVGCMQGCDECRERVAAAAAAASAGQCPRRAAADASCAGCVAPRVYCPCVVLTCTAPGRTDHLYRRPVRRH